MRKILTLLLALLIATNTFAQAQNIDAMLREDGKIYVVITVILILLAGLFIYLIRTDRKISKLERHEN